MANVNRFTAALWDLDTFYIWEDFWTDQNDLEWVDTVTDTGTALVGDESRGVMTLTPSDGTVADNDEVYLAAANAAFKLEANRPLYGRCRLQFTETAAGVYNAVFGFANALSSANFIVDDGAGLRASGTIVAIEKRDNETRWRLTTRRGSAVTSTLSTKAAGGSAYQVLELIVNDWDQAECSVVAKVDGDYLKDDRGNVIVHRVPYASADQMTVGIGAKLGAATNNDVLKADYIYAAQQR